MKYMIEDKPKEFECWFEEVKGSIFLYCSIVTYSKILKIRRVGSRSCVSCVVTSDGYGYKAFKNMINNGEGCIKSVIKDELIRNGFIGGKFTDIQQALMVKHIIKE